MKTYRIQWILALVLSASAFAKPPGGRNGRQPQGPPPQGPPQGPPLFIVLDTDRDGVLSDDEIKAATEVIAKLDKNHDGNITIEELRMPPPPPKDDDEPKGPPPQDGKRPVPPVIHALDADHDGTISAQEMENAPESLKALDNNGDGELSPEELRPAGPPPRDGSDPQGPPPANDEGAVE